MEVPTPQRPNEVWVADITYIPTEHDHWLYLAAVMDLGSRRIVGWAMSPSIDTHLVLDALAMARHQRRPRSGASSSTATAASSMPPATSAAHSRPLHSSPP